MIYTKDLSSSHIKVVQLIFENLWRYGLFANLKKWHFHWTIVYFLDYMMFIQEMSIKEKKIEIVKNWPKPKLLQDIEVFIRFTNFYWYFIQRFSKIALLLTFLFKTSITVNQSNLIEIDIDSFLSANTKEAFLGL